MMRRLGTGCLLAVVATAAPAGEPLKLNPFNDPFLPATEGGRACPVPLGPAYTDAQVRVQSHHRAERGTSCWLEGRCKEPNAYRGDAGLARNVVQALRSDAALADTRIWVTVERAFVTLEGCVGSAAQVQRAEAVAKGVEGVHLVLPYLALPGEGVRYRTVEPK